MEDDEKSIVNENETKKNDGCLKKLGKLFKKSTKEQGNIQEYFQY